MLGKRLSAVAVLLGLLTLSACGQPSESNPPTITPPSQGLKSVGLFELNMNGVGSEQAKASIQAVRGGISAQASEIGGLNFTYYSSSTVVDNVNKMLYVSSTFTVENNSSTAIAVPTYIPVDTAGAYATDGETPFRNVVSRKGVSMSPAGITLDTAHTSSNGQIIVDPNATPLVNNLDTGALQLILPTATTAPGISHQGWQSAALPAGAGVEVGVEEKPRVTFAMRVPLQGSDVGDNDPFRFSLIFAVADSPASVSLTNIASVQGSTPSGDVAAALSGVQTVEGVVTADYRTSTQQGFYVQEEGIDADGNVNSSDGIFVYCGTSCGAVAGANIGVGDRVRLVGTPSEFVTVTQLDVRSGSVTELADAATVGVPEATALSLPLDVALRERYEGMRVRISGVVTNNFTLGRGSSFDLADARIPTFTQVNAPSVAGNAAYQTQVKNQFIRVDDGSRAQNPELVFGRANQPLSALNTLRGGDTATVTGVLSYGNDGWTSSGSIDTYRIHATQADATVAPTNARLAAPEAVGGTLRVGAMNVLNYFTTMVSSNSGCTANGFDPNARGANNCQEFTRQQDKIVSAIEGLNPDMLGLMEIQNDFAKGANSSVANLVTALNARAGSAKYAYVDPGANVGGDAISLAMIYQPARVTQVGTLAILDNSFNAKYLDTCNRPTWAQTFQSNANGGRFTAVMMHLKSKGSACAALGDADTGDGQGNAYQARAQAAQVIVDWLATNPTGVTESDRILMGDFNAYASETPLSILAAGGYNNLFSTSAYSYQFDGQWGSLDHAVASSSLQAQVTGQTKWHINSDEPTVLDYNTEFKSAGQLGSYYNSDAFRSSDHDPVLVGLNLDAQTPITPPTSAPKTVLSANPAALSTTTAGGTLQTTVSTTTTNYSGGNLTVSATAAAGWTASVPATTAPNGTFTLSVTVPAGTATGTYPVVVSTAGDAGVAPASLTVNVNVTNVTPPPTANLPWINEFHYDDNGTTDSNEFVEVVVPAGVDVNTLSLVLYNGSGGVTYGTTAGNSFGTGTAAGTYTIYKVLTPGLQNGAPDGFALCTTTSVIQFLSYEGTMTATNGCANGLTSTDVGVAEVSSTPVGSSLQLTGTGNKYSDFTWTAPSPNTGGAVNTGQTLN